MNDGSVEQYLELERRLESFHSADRAAGRPPELWTDLVLRIRLEVVIDDEPAAGSVRQPFDPLVLRQIEAWPVLGASGREFRVADGHRGDPQSDREIALEQQRRRLQG